MTLKFDIKQIGTEQYLCIDTDDAMIRVEASDNELRRLLIDLIHEFDVPRCDDV